MTALTLWSGLLELSTGFSTSREGWADLRGVRGRMGEGEWPPSHKLCGVCLVLCVSLSCFVTWVLL